MSQTKNLNRQEFAYRLEDVPFFEVLYGKHLISLGGKQAIKNMFSD